jgi:hypothetical protein
MKLPSLAVQLFQVVLGFGLTSSFINEDFKEPHALLMLHAGATVPLGGGLGAA